MKRLITLSFLLTVLTMVMMQEVSKSQLIHILNVPVNDKSIKESREKLDETAFKKRCTYGKEEIQSLENSKLVRKKSVRSGVDDKKIMECVSNANAIIDFFEKRHYEAQKRTNGIYDIGLYQRDLAGLEAEADKLSIIYLSIIDPHKRTKIENICDDIYANMIRMRASVYVHNWITKASAAVGASAGIVLGGIPGATIGSAVGYWAGKHFIKIDP
ncbi:uncharacterized protein LOC129574639 [Sitodiplosis mosellana]|uniref:uncharacterized protein LOC129574639 n=1 Tax=Sitodiplosis mosellana TaxID=263140 RepID=UPI002444A6DF|nr:uncharacterized protein LOC129574639 [Sitodiplosis mosellana]